MDGTNTPLTYPTILPDVPTSATGLSLTIGGKTDSSGNTRGGITKTFALVPNQEVYDIVLSGAETTTLTRSHTINHGMEVVAKFTGADDIFFGNLSVLSQAPSSADGAFMLQAPVRHTGTNGVRSITLPTTYTNYNYLEVVGYAGVSTGFIRIPTAVLAVQQDGDTRWGFETNEDGNSEGMRWTPTTRTMQVINQSGGQGSIYISFARLVY